MLAISVIGIAKDPCRTLVDNAKAQTVEALVQTVAALAPDVEDSITPLTLAASATADVQHSKVMERFATLATGIAKDHLLLRCRRDLLLEALTVPTAQSAVMDLGDGTRLHGAREGLRALMPGQDLRGANLLIDPLLSGPQQQLSRTVNGGPR